MNKTKLFEHFGGNTFKIAAPQAMGMMAETEKKPIQLSGEQFDKAWYAVKKNGKSDDNGNISYKEWTIQGYARNGLEEFGQLLYKGSSVINLDAKESEPPGV